MTIKVNVITLVAGSLICSLASGQDCSSEIDTQVWKPFTQALINRDAVTFISLHSPDVIRVEGNQHKIIGFEEYKKNMESSWPKRKESFEKEKIKHTFELRFLQRICTGSAAYEVGYFKNEVSRPTGEKRISYGKFYVTLRKENDQWKILVDADFDEGGTITEDEFQAAAPIK